MIKHEKDPKKMWDTLERLAKGSGGTVYLGQPREEAMRAR